MVEIMNVLPMRATEAHLEPCQTSKMDHFAKIVNSFQPLTILAKRFIFNFGLSLSTLLD